MTDDPIEEYIKAKLTERLEAYLAANSCLDPDGQMWRDAISARGGKERWPQDQVCAAYWEGYLKALVDLTGLAPKAIEAEMDRRLP